MKRKFLLVCVVVLSLFVFLSCGKKEEKTLVMGIVPHRDAEKLVEEIKPLEEKLSKELGVKVKGFIATNYVSVVEGFGSGNVDFGIIPPFAVVLANNEFKAKPILVVENKKGTTTYRSQFLVNVDSGIESLADLKGKKVAFVDPSSTSGYLFPAALLKENSVNPEKDIDFLYSGGHDKSLQLLLNKDVDAAATYDDIRTRYTKEFPTAMDTTKVLAYTEDIPGIAVTTSTSMSDEDVEKLKVAFKNIASTEDGKELLIKLFSIYGFQDTDMTEFEVIKKTAELMELDLKKQ